MVKLIIIIIILVVYMAARHIYSKATGKEMW